MHITIFDLAGQAVRSLTGAGAPTETSVTWDARDRAGHAVSAGRYLVRLDTGTERLVQKVVLIR